MPEAHAEFLAQFADVALHDTFIDIFVEHAVDRAEDLGTLHALAAIAHQIFEDAPFTAGEVSAFSPSISGSRPSK